MSEFEGDLTTGASDEFPGGNSTQQGMPSTKPPVVKRLRRASTKPHEMALHQASTVKQKEQRELAREAVSDVSLQSIAVVDSDPPIQHPLRYLFSLFSVALGRGQSIQRVAD